MPETRANSMSEATMSREDEIKAISDERLKEIQERDKFARTMNALGTPENAELAAACQDRSDLLSEVARLRAENEELRSKVADLENDIECAMLGFP